jgi:hypothetical protein
MSDTELAKAILLHINPLVPTKGTRGESWAFPQPLRSEVNEFGWDDLDYVKRLLSDVEALLKARNGA